MVHNSVVSIKRVASLKYVTQLLLMATSQDHRVDNCWLPSPVQPSNHQPDVMVVIIVKT